MIDGILTHNDISVLLDELELVDGTRLVEHVVHVVDEAGVEVGGVGRIHDTIHVGQVGERVEALEHGVEYLQSGVR